MNLRHQLQVLLIQAYITLLYTSNAIFSTALHQFLHVTCPLACLYGILYPERKGLRYVDNHLFRQQ